MRWKFTPARSPVGPIILLGLMSLILVFSGCANFRTMELGLSESHIKNTDTHEESVANFLCAWPFYDGIIRGALQDRMKEMPGKVEDALDELTTLAEMCKDTKYENIGQFKCHCDFTDWKPEFDIVYTDQNRTDFGLGYSVGCEIKICTDIVKDALLNVAPDVLKMIPWPIF